jgi:hypothetical protein
LKGLDKKRVADRFALKSAGSEQRRQQHALVEDLKQLVEQNPQSSRLLFFRNRLAQLPHLAIDNGLHILPLRYFNLASFYSFGTPMQDEQLRPNPNSDV